MDLYDKKIIKLLIENCRYPLSDIAKAVNLSKDSVKYRINRLEKKQIITDYSLMIDPRIYGYSINHLLIKLKFIKNKEEIISKLKKNKNITFISSQSGTYDLQIIFHTKSTFEKNNIKNQILECFEDKIKDYKEVNHVEDYNFSFLFSDIDINIKFKKKNNTSFSKQLEENKYITGEEPPVSKFDDIDKLILKELIKNPREKLRIIGQKIDMSSEGVKKRINSIIQKKGILKFSLYPNHDKLDLFNYMLLFKCNNFNTDTKIKLNQFLKSKNYILYAAKYDGAYNLFVYILAKNPKEFSERFNELKEIIDEDIISYDLSIVTQVHKFVMMNDKFFDN